MSDITCCKKGLVYTFLGLNIFLSFIINLLLWVCTYDITLLDWYQYIYLILAIIIWLLLFLTYIAKLVLILIGKLPSKYILLTWLVLNIPASVFFLIAFIFDFVMFGQDDINWSLYIILFVIFFIVFIVFTGFDFFLIKLQIKMGDENKNKNMINSNSNSLQGKDVLNIELKDTRDKNIINENNENDKNEILELKNNKIKEN